MQIFKYATEGHCLLKTNNYSKTLEIILLLTAEVKKDFPQLADRDIQFHIYNDDHWGKQMGLEFVIPANVEVPADYQPLYRLPLYYG
ncbi:hypothetical protein H6F43_11850 [Leptolyngbya sp. FACHB-36]|uniref:hypothetical protein n=1 Tax=Leptolyngbya sp. FACHB-36 TaxID=2692808 RepID=UPI001681AFEF|nr:hypothetical protein [Leptolyngbya sp. FACHB-36]MBD2020873.1 hypothetical protein [Leptolyngbya sp. FACHB-36]